MRAIWNGKTIAESNDTLVIEGNHYFPPETVNKEFLNDSRTITSCFWKGLASYYTIEIDGEINADAAWYYPKPTEAAKQLRNYIAFWKGVEISE